MIHGVMVARQTLVLQVPVRARVDQQIDITTLNQSIMEKAVVPAQSAEVTFVMPNTASLGKLKEMQPDFSLTMKYKTGDDWAAIKGQEVRAYFMGIKEIPNENGELVTCGVFVSATECFIAGQKLLVEAVRQLDSRTPVAITYKEKRANKSTEGSTMVFDVKTLIAR